MSKAWGCYEEESCIFEVVFADTRGKAKSYFKAMDTFDNYRFCELRPRRLKELDYLNHPDGYVMDFSKDEDRIALVKHIYSGCLPDSKDECESCCAKEWCRKYKEEL